MSCDERRRDRGVAVPPDAFVRHVARRVTAPLEALVFVLATWRPRQGNCGVVGRMDDGASSVGGQRRGSEIQESGAHATGHATMWQTILECLNVCGHAWKVLQGQAYACRCVGTGDRN